MTARRKAKALIPDAVCSCGGTVESDCCERILPGTKCPRGVCRGCGRTWRRVPHLPLMAMGAGSRDLEPRPDLTSLRDRATPGGRS